MPGFYRSLLSTAPHHQQAQLVEAIADAMAASASEKERMRLSAVETTFPPEVRKCTRVHAGQLASILYLSYFSFFASTRSYRRRWRGIPFF